MKEIERRYLLSNLPEEELKRAIIVAEVKNVYLLGPTIQVRYTRRTYLKHHNGAEGEKVYRRTVKVGHGLERFEFKEEAPKDLYKAISKLSQAKVIKKIRYQMPAKGGLIWEIDAFQDRDLVLAEIEIPSAEYEVDIPKWLSKVIIREVTEEKEYEGASLAL